MQLPDPVDAAGPNQICQECYDKCLKWLNFKTVCNENEKMFSQKTEKSPESLDPSEYTEYIDGSLEDIVLQVEDDEEDLLAVLQNESKENGEGETCLNHKSDHSVVHWPEIKDGQDIIEQRLSLLMDIPLVEADCGIIDSYAVPKTSPNASSTDQYSQCTKISNSRNSDCLETHDQETVQVCISDLPGEEDNGKLIVKTETDEVANISEPGPSNKDKESTLDYPDVKNVKQEKMNTDNVELWICTVCDANLLGSEEYRDHLKLHLTEDDVVS